MTVSDSSMGDDAYQVPEIEGENGAPIAAEGRLRP